MRFAQLNISILQRYSTVDFSIILLKLFLFLVYIGIIFIIMPSVHFSVKMKIFFTVIYRYYCTHVVGGQIAKY